MKTFPLFVIAFFCLNHSLTYSQVGINNTSPNAVLDIQASNQTSPSNTDGILIPKVDEFPATNPTINQDGMLIYNTGNGAPLKGFYFWNNSTSSWNEVGNGQLAKVFSGFTLKGRDETLFGNPGNNALDFSTSNFSSNTLGATGGGSFAVGNNNTASGARSFAAGQVNEATGSDSFAIGFGTDATGAASFSSGRSSRAFGRYSHAMGEQVLSESLSQMSIGRHNTSVAGDATNWVLTDRLFVIGNGLDSGNRSDALTILKNGNATVNGTITGTIETPTNATLNATWTAYANGYETPGYYKDNDRVYLRGLLRKTGAYSAGELIFTLPIDYRPASRILQHAGQNGNLARIDVLADGSVLYMAGANGSLDFISLEGISFRVD